MFCQKFKQQSTTKKNIITWYNISGLLLYIRNSITFQHCLKISFFLHNIIKMRMNKKTYQTAWLDSRTKQRASCSSLALNGVCLHASRRKARRKKKVSKKKIVFFSLVGVCKMDSIIYATNGVYIICYCYCYGMEDILSRHLKKVYILYIYRMQSLNHWYLVDFVFIVLYIRCVL